MSDNAIREAIRVEMREELEAVRAEVAKALDQLDETRWDFGGTQSMIEYANTIHGRSMQRVNNARELLARVLTRKLP